MIMMGESIRQIWVKVPSVSIELSRPHFRQMKNLLTVHAIALSHCSYKSNSIMFCILPEKRSSFCLSREFKATVQQIDVSYAYMLYCLK